MSTLYLLPAVGPRRRAHERGPGADHAVADGRCPGCGFQALYDIAQANGASRDECGFKVQGTGRRPSEDDRAYEADAVAACCGQRVGLLRLEVSTLFGVREDEAVARLGVRIY